MRRTLEFTADECRVAIAALEVYGDMIADLGHDGDLDPADGVTAVNLADYIRTETGMTTL